VTVEDEWMDAVRITAVRSIGVSGAGDELGYVLVEINGSEDRALAFGAELANTLVIAVTAAAAHLEAKRATRPDPGSKTFPIRPLPVRAGNAVPATRGEQLVVILELETQEGFVLRYEMSEHSADVLAKGLQRSRWTGPTGRSVRGT
jgi:hypothetical protein